MLTIRLQRGGKRNTAQYKLVLAKKTAANQKQFVEILGAYNPHTKDLTIRSQERLSYWMNDQHVELSETVHNLFITKEILKDKKKVTAFRVPKKEVPAEEVAPEASAESNAETTETTQAVEETAPEAEAPTSTEAPAEEATEQKAE